MGIMRCLYECLYYAGYGLFDEDNIMFATLAGLVGVFDVDMVRSEEIGCLHSLICLITAEVISF